MTGPRPAVRARNGGLDVGGTVVPLVSGEVQFWRLDPGDWGPVLDAVAAAGVPIVSTYLSWRRHEPEPGRLEWGAREPRLDAARFVRECGRRGLYVQLKPGPWICAEEPGGGYPDWLTARTGDLALDAAGHPIGGYNPPFVHPVPSVHAPGYRAAARDWLSHVWAELGPLAHPDGPIVAVQLDNEPGYAFQDALYVADYHPAAVAAFRDWLSHRYRGDVAAWHAAWGAAACDDFARAQPPRPTTGPGDPIALVTSPTPASEVAVRDWIAFTTDSIVGHLRELWQTHRDLGFGHLLPTVNLINHPVHDVPVPHAAVREGLAGQAAIGADQYYVPPIGWPDVNRLALTAATARAAGEPVVWAPELMSGIWRSPGEAVTYPDPTPAEQAAWWGAALALGHQGFNLYMLADRENWELAPIRRDGAAGSGLDRVHDLARALRHQALRTGVPRTVVALLWDGDDALAAYAATGTARQAEVSWGSPEAGLAYRETLRIGSELVAAGFGYELWDPRRQGLPQGRTVVGSAASRWLARHGDTRQVTAVDPGGSVAAALGRRPPARVARGSSPDPGGVAMLHDSGHEVLLHVARWLTGPAELVLADAWPDGRWEPLLGASAALARVAPNRWRLPPDVPHLVLHWTSTISNESADVEEP